MKKIILFVLLCAAMSVSAVNYCSTASWGCAGNSVTGGGNATPTLVSSFSELKAAIGGKKPSNKVVIITKDITFTSMLTMQDASNITIMALPGVKLISNEQNSTTSGILFVKRSSNIIIRNLTFEGPGAYDCDGNDNLCFEKVTNSWVDHCDFQDGCDGNFDNKSTTDNITVTWCRFRYLKEPKAGGSGGSADHRFTNLLGSSASDKPSDGTYNMTWAYCWWDEGCKERMLRCRNAELHFLNCYWNSSVANYYVGPENAKAYFEGCTFAGKANTSKLIFKSYGGTNACKFVNCSGNLPSNSGTVSAPTYTYDKLSPAESKAMVTNAECGAGATLTVTKAGEVGSSCDSSSPTPDPEPVDPDPEDPDPEDPEDPTPSGDLTWNFSSSDFNGLGKFTESKTINGLTLLATSDKGLEVASTDITIEGVKFSHVLKLGGTGNASYRNVSFAVTGPCTLEVYCMNSGSSGERTLNIYSGSYGGSTLTTMTATTTASKLSYAYTGSATTLYMGSANSNINLYAIKLTYSGEEPEPAKPVYTLSYDENGGSGEMDEQEAEEGNKLTVKTNTFTAPVGYAFSEWNDNYKGAGTSYTAGQEITMTADLTLYAVWAPKTYTVTLDANGGTGGTANVQAIFDDPMPNITIPSKEGYLFLGYFSETNGAGTQYYDANGAGTNSWTTPADATLYAAWEEQSSEAPVETGDLHFWFFFADDAATNGVTNDESFFSNMVTDGSQKAGSITIDGTSYAITRRTGDPNDGKFGFFTVPAEKRAVFYALAISSGGSDRQIDLIGSETYELSVPGGSSAYQRIESDTLPAGTYSIERAASSGNVRLGIVVVKIMDAGGETPDPVDPDPIDPDPVDPDPVDPDPVDPTPSGDLTWNFSSSEFTALMGDITSTQTVNGLTIVATSDKKSSIASSPKEIEGISFTHALKTGGTGAASYRNLNFAVTGPCTIDVYLISAKNTEERTLNIYSDTYGDNLIGTLAAPATTPVKQTYNYTRGAATLYLGSAKDGINFYAINLTYPSSTPTEVEEVTGYGLPITGKKVLRDGQLLIIRDGKMYNALGQMTK